MCATTTADSEGRKAFAKGCIACLSFGSGEGERKERRERGRKDGRMKERRRRG